MYDLFEVLSLDQTQHMVHSVSKTKELAAACALGTRVFFFLIERCYLTISLEVFLRTRNYKCNSLTDLYSSLSFECKSIPASESMVVCIIVEKDVAVLFFTVAFGPSHVPAQRK